MKKLLVETPITIAVSLIMVFLGQYIFEIDHIVDDGSGKSMGMFALKSIIAIAIAGIIAAIISKKYPDKEASNLKKGLVVAFNIIVVLLGLSFFVMYFNT